MNKNKTVTFNKNVFIRFYYLTDEEKNMKKEVTRKIISKIKIKDENCIQIFYNILENIFMEWF